MLLSRLRIRERLSGPINARIVGYQRYSNPLYSKKEIRDAIKMCKGCLDKAARHIGCSYDTIRRRVRKCPELKRLTERERRSSRVKVVDTARYNVETAVDEGDIKTSIFVLRTLGKRHGWTERKEITGKEGGPIDTHTDIDVNLKMLSDTEVDELLINLLKERKVINKKKKK